MSVKFEDNSMKVTGALEDVCINWLYEAAGVVKKSAQRTASKYGDKGDTMNSYKYIVDESKLIAYVGSPSQNALWEEYGTGEYALNKDGRKTPWYIPVEKVTGEKKPTYKGKVIIVHGKDGQKFYKTNGKKPRRILFTAFEKTQNKIQKRLKSLLKGLNG